MLWVLIGWLGNACFFSRFLVQWWASERAGRSVAPAAFWWLSLAGAACLLTYTVAAGEIVLVVGLAVNSAIYARNLWIGPEGGRSPALHAGLVALLALAAVLLLVAAGAVRLPPDFAASPGWLLCSVAGQALWSTRFVLQWVATERRGDSHFPPSFWIVSLAGNLLLLAYVLHRGDPVLIAGYALGPVVQVRNLILERRRLSRARRVAPAAPEAGTPSSASSEAPLASPAFRAPRPIGDG